MRERWRRLRRRRDRYLSTFPLAVGLSALLNQSYGSPALYSLAATGGAVALTPLTRRDAQTLKRNSTTSPSCMT